MLSKFQKSQSAQKSRHQGANAAKTAKNKRKKRHDRQQHNWFMLPEGMVLKHSHGLVSIPSSLPIPIHSTDLNINKKIRALVSIHSSDSIGDLKVSVRGDSNIPSVL